MSSHQQRQQTEGRRRLTQSLGQQKHHRAQCLTQTRTESHRPQHYMTHTDPTADIGGTSQKPTVISRSPHREKRPLGDQKIRPDKTPNWFKNCIGHSKNLRREMLLLRRAALLQPCVPPSPRPKARQQGHLPLPIEIPGTTATTLQSAIKATSPWVVAPHETSPAIERPEARLRHALTVASKRQGNQPAMSKLAAQALSCERQGFFRGLSGLGGRRNQETPQPPPSNIALRCPR